MIDLLAFVVVVALILAGVGPILFALALLWFKSKSRPVSGQKLWDWTEPVPMEFILSDDLDD